MTADFRPSCHLLALIRLARLGSRPAGGARTGQAIEAGRRETLSLFFT